MMRAAWTTYYETLAPTFLALTTCRAARAQCFDWRLCTNTTKRCACCKKERSRHRVQRRNAHTVAFLLLQSQRLRSLQRGEPSTAFLSNARFHLDAIYCHTGIASEDAQVCTQTKHWMSNRSFVCNSVRVLDNTLATPNSTHLISFARSRARTHLQSRTFSKSGDLASGFSRCDAVNTAAPIAGSFVISH